MITRVKETNEYEKEIRQDLPDLLEALIDWKSGNKETLKKFFYHELKINKPNSKYPEIDSKLKFWDDTLNNKLYQLRRKFQKVNDVQYGMKVEGKSVKVKQRHIELSENDFMERFYDYLLVGNAARKDGKCFADFIQVEGRIEGDREEQLLMLREYILIYFERDFKHILDTEKGIKTRFIENKMYRIEPQFSTISFEDITTYNDDSGYDEENDNAFVTAVTEFGGDGALDHIEDIQKENIEDEVENKFNYIKKNWKNLLTSNQVERIEHLIKVLEEEPNKYILEVFDELTDQVIQSGIKDIWFAKEKDTANDSTLRNKTNIQLNNIRNTMERKLEKLEIDLSRSKNRLKSDYYIEGLSEEDNYKYHTYLKRWMSEDELYKLVNNEITIAELFEKYSIDTRVGADFHFRNIPVTVYKPTSDDNASMFITDEQFAVMMSKRINKIIEGIRSRDIEFYCNADGLYEMFSKAKNKILLPMTEEVFKKFKHGGYDGKYQIVSEHLNPKAYKVSPGAYKGEAKRDNKLVNLPKITYVNADEYRKRKVN